MSTGTEINYLPGNFFPGKWFCPDCTNLNPKDVLVCLCGFNGQENKDCKIIEYIPDLVNIMSGRLER